MNNGQPKLVAIIPARGGSKRIPRKNIRDFCGIPVLSLTIQKLKATSLFDRIIVSTDDLQVAEIAIESGAEYIERPAELADDFTTTIDVVSSVVLELKYTERSDVLFCCVYPISPEISFEHLSQAMNLFREKDLDFVFAAKRFPSPIFRALVLADDGYSKMVFPEHETNRSQDLDPTFSDAGLFYMGKKEAWVEKRPILNGKSAFIEIGKYESIDVDDEEDWIIAEELFRIRNSK